MRILKAGISCLLMMMLLGCWDRKEIDELGIVLGVAFDKQSNQISTLHTFALPKTSSEKSDVKSEKWVNLENTGDLVSENVRGLVKSSIRFPTYEHLKVIVISEELGRSVPLKQMTDYLLRNPESRRSVKLVVSKGKAGEMLKVTSPLDMNPAYKLSEIADRSEQLLELPPKTTLGEVSSKLTSKTSFYVQRSELNANREAVLSGAVAVKGTTGKVIGSLTEEETRGLNFILPNNNKKSAIVKVFDPESEQQFIYELRKIRANLIPVVQGKQISFVVSVQTEGRMREDWRLQGNAFDSRFIKQSEKAAADTIQQAVKALLNKTQKELGADIAGFGKQLSIHYPRTWKEVADYPSTFPYKSIFGNSGTAAWCSLILRCRDNRLQKNTCL
ncbi:Ger(x)C family spore germination protein [Paenibacillus sp. GD4]|uniref:Ger(x)C family spore germination protein n=1 Tax=Paenibacillus sp. GD4 TaxID=3068890 RepID=UPI0027965ED7|nr:Ger(x)C family spore germination protein [Paenibacillus sp. GD4]MDQ1912657.1 Ger(x)C family spore germination protein [Paenibacillus sp. GD4]